MPLKHDLIECIFIMHTRTLTHSAGDGPVGTIECKWLYPRPQMAYVTQIIFCKKSIRVSLKNK